MTSRAQYCLRTQLSSSSMILSIQQFQMKCAATWISDCITANVAFCGTERYNTVMYSYLIEILLIAMTCFDHKGLLSSWFTFHLYHLMGDLAVQMKRGWPWRDRWDQEVLEWWLPWSTSSATQSSRTSWMKKSCRMWRQSCQGCTFDFTRHTR